jgi:hypothetical protein
MLVTNNKQSGKLLTSCFLELVLIFETHFLRPAKIEINQTISLKLLHVRRCGANLLQK